MRRALFWLLALAVVALGAPPLLFAMFREPPPELPPAGQRVELAPGVGLNVLEAGAGPPLVLIHGHPGSAYDWLELRDELLARDTKVLAYDRLGYGRSDARRDGDYTVDANAEELLALLAARGLRDVTLVGHSYGGGTAIVAARKQPERIAHLVLVGSVGPGVEDRPAPPAWVTELLAGPVLSWISRVPPLSRRLRTALTRQAFDPAPVSPAYRTRLDANFGRPHTLATFQAEGRDLDGRADLDPGPLAQPILIVHGDGDRLVPPAVAHELHRRARQSELWFVPGGGHMLTLTHAGPLAERIVAFVRTR